MGLDKIPDINILLLQSVAVDLIIMVSGDVNRIVLIDQTKFSSLKNSKQFFAMFVLV